MAHLNGNASNFIYTPFPLLAQFQRTHYKSTQGVLKIEMTDTIFRGFFVRQRKKRRNILIKNRNANMILLNIPILSMCGNFRIFLSLRFYVKSIIENLEVMKLPFIAIL